ncbi:uncharacterized protein LOC126691560 [Quercus robur]|uniref:uncharacterized protein LOC126691560 n=1 Tax=Quercus robur TaxID=38942 RepID=UPI002163DEDB|nr:uncharacterized protein LOC126691560 [Quercus robur]
MNIIAWNCRGALKPEFQNHVRELVQSHNPAMLIVMETRVGGSRAKEIIDRLPFDVAIHTETIGYAGELWLLWNSNRVIVAPLATIEQEIHVSVKVRPSDSECILSAIYASPRFNERCVLWNNLVNVASLHGSPWIIAGDFNEVLADDEIYGVRDAWGQSNRLDEAVDKFTRDATAWNRNHFGNIFAKKRCVLARLDGVQKALAERPSNSLVELEKVLQRELNEVLNQEQELWALKSRVNWMMLGDKNTSFFHVSTIVRRRRNQISCLKNSVGDWIHEETQIMRFIQEGFGKLYTTSHLEVKLQLGPISPWQATLSDMERDSLYDLVFVEEIKSTLWSIKAFKAPGSDGLHAGHKTKTNARRLVSPVKLAFVPGRKRIDNAIIVQEVIHTISKKKGRVGYMAIKVDLEKAYDKLE